MEFNDSLLDNERAMSLGDKRALNFMESTAVLKEGNYEIAKDPGLFQKYSAFIDNLLDRAYASKVLDSQLSRPCVASWFLPRHPVFHPKKPGKVWVVFDCAAKFRGISLNNVLLPGPDMTNNFIGVLTWFRNNKSPSWPTSYPCSIRSVSIQMILMFCVSCGGLATIWRVNLKSIK